MKQNILKTLMLIAVLLNGSHAFAHDLYKDGIYYNITSTTNLTVEVTHKGNSYYEYSNWYSGNIVIPETIVYNSSVYTVTSIGSDAFHGNDLISITIPETVSVIRRRAFQYCDKLASIKMSNGINKIEENAFYGCSGLIGDLILPNSLWEIGAYSFYGCNGLSVINIGNSVVSIGDQAFLGCTGLEYFISNSSTPPSCGRHVFDQIPETCELQVPIECVQLYATAVEWKNFEIIIGKDLETRVEYISINNNINSNVEYYNLHGVRVNNPKNGMFIKKEGERAFKVML